VKALPTDFAVTCPLCGEITTKILFDQEESRLDSSTIGSSRRHTSPGRILRCGSCGFGFRQTRPSPEQLKELYRQMDPRVYDSELHGRNRTAKTHLRIVQRYLRPGRVLDVGCASGLFLFHAMQVGWSVTGIEPNEALCEDARRILGGKGSVYCDALETVSLEGKFDAITAWDVLEHVPHPRAFLSACRSLLRPGGFLFLNVPDLDSWEGKLLGRRWPLLLPEHLNYFNKHSLSLCAKQADLVSVQFGRRLAWFSLNYITYRITQHGIYGSHWLRALAQGQLGRFVLPVSLGEVFIVLSPIVRDV